MNCFLCLSTLLVYCSPRIEERFQQSITNISTFRLSLRSPHFPWNHLSVSKSGWLSACLLFYLSICMSISLSCLSVCLVACLSSSLFVSLYICPSGCLSVCLKACLCLSICLSIWLSVYLSICMSISPSICLLGYMSLSISVCLSACLSSCMYIWQALFILFHVQSRACFKKNSQLHISTEIFPSWLFIPKIP